jgi:hypothetical protein
MPQTAHPFSKHEMPQTAHPFSKQGIKLDAPRYFYKFYLEVCTNS